MKKICTTLLLLLTITACSAPKIGGTQVSVDQAGVQSSVAYGTITSVMDVQVNNDKSGNVTLSTIGGGVAGGFLGNQIGKGSGRTVATVGGAILGAIAGSEMSKIVNTQKGYQLVIRLDNGRDTAVVQGADIQFHRGQRVQLISNGGKVRVLPI